MTVSITDLFNRFEILRDRANEPELPAQLVSTFLFIASQGDVAQADIITATGISKSATSRNVSWLGPRNKLKRRDGLKWVRIYQDPENWRANRIELTPLGREVAEALVRG